MRRDHGVLFAVAAILVAVGLLWPDGAVEAPRGDDHAAEVAGPAGSITKGGLADAVANDLTRREATPEPAAVEAWLAHPYTLGLEVRLVDATGLPMPFRILRLAASGCTLQDFFAITDADGIVRLQLPARAPQGEVVLADPLGLLHRLTLQHGVVRKITLGGRGQPEATGGQFLSVKLSRGAEDRLRPTLQSGLPFERDFQPHRGSQDDPLHPFSVFRTAAAAARSLAEAVFFGEDTVTAFFNSGHELVDHKATAAPPTRIAGTVYDEHGKPVAKADVALLRDGTGLTLRSTAGEHGQFRFEKLVAGAYTVRAGGDRKGIGKATVDVAAGTTTVAVHLQTGTTVGGVVTNAEGRAVPFVRLVWSADDENWWDLTTSDADGRFLFANLPDGRGKVLVFPSWQPSPPPGQTGHLPLGVQSNVLANAGELAVLYDAATTGKLRLELPVWASEGATGVRLWNEKFGLGIELGREPNNAPPAGHRYTVDSLASGWYRLEVLVPSLGCVDLGRHWLEPAGTLDLGVLPLPAPCEVELRLGDAPPAAGNEHKPPPLPSPQSRIELYAIRNDLDVRLAVDNLVDHCDLRLPAGDYALARQAPGGPLEWHRFTARRGEVVRVPAGK